MYNFCFKIQLQDTEGHGILKTDNQLQEKRAVLRKDVQQMKKWMRTLAAGCTLVLVLSAFVFASAQEIKTAEVGEMPEICAEELELMRRDLLMDWDINSGNHTSDETPEFEMVPGDGKYLRWYCRLSSHSALANVYLYDVGKGEIVSAMSPRMDPGEERTIVYDVGSDSELCQYYILIESANGGTVRASVRANQIHNR